MNKYTERFKLDVVRNYLYGKEVGTGSTSVIIRWLVSESVHTEMAALKR
jgi:hypothetical protein